MRSSIGVEGIEVAAAMTDEHLLPSVILRRRLSLKTAVGSGEQEAVLLTRLEADPEMARSWRRVIARLAAAGKRVDADELLQIVVKTWLFARDNLHADKRLVETETYYVELLKSLADVIQHFDLFQNIDLDSLGPAMRNWAPRLLAIPKSLRSAETWLRFEQDSVRDAPSRIPSMFGRERSGNTHQRQFEVLLSLALAEKYEDCCDDFVLDVSVALWGEEGATDLPSMARRRKRAVERGSRFAKKRADQD